MAVVTIPNSFVAATKIQSAQVNANFSAIATALNTTLFPGGVLPIANGGTNGATRVTAFDNLSPMSALGDIIYGGTSGTNTRLAGNTVALQKSLVQTGTGAVSAAPSWDFLYAATYTPTVTNNTNCAAIAITSGAVWSYLRIGNTVFVAGNIDIDPTLAGPTNTRGYISIPVGNNFSALTQAAGNGACQAKAGAQCMAGSIYADSGSQRVVYDFSAIDGANLTHGVTFMYQVQ